MCHATNTVFMIGLGSVLVGSNTVFIIGFGSAFVGYNWVYNS